MPNDLKTQFLKVFTNLPIPERENTIYVSSKYGPMSWHIVRLEVEGNTELGKEALSFLKRLDIL